MFSRRGCNFTGFVIARSRIAAVAGIVFIPLAEAHRVEVVLKKRPAKSETAACCLEIESGLYHQVHFRSVLSQELARLDRWGRPLSLAVLDLPEMSAAGWAEVGRKVRASLRRIDVAARLDGRLVAVLLPDADTRKTCRWLGELLAELGQAECLGGRLPACGHVLARPWEGRKGEDLLALALAGLNQSDLSAVAFDGGDFDLDSATAIAADERNLLFDGFKALGGQPKH